MDHLTMWTMAHRAMSHPAWTTLAGGTTAGAGVGHTVGHAAGRIAASLGHDAVTHPKWAAGVAVVIAVAVWIGVRRRGGARRRPPVRVPHHDHGGGGPWLGLGVAVGALVFVIVLVANWKPATPVRHTAAPTPTPTVTHTTIVQHITHVTHVTRAAATHIPDGLWWVAGITVVAVVVIYLNRRRSS
jgi:hypothetical protein